MKQKKVHLCAILLLFIGLTGLHAQEAVPATGGNASGIGGSASYTVGQVVYNTYTGINGSEAQGVQQPYEISVMVGEAGNITLQCAAYPNPANDELTVIKTSEGAGIIEIYNYLGEKIISSELKNYSSIISIKDLNAGVYLYKIIVNNSVVKADKLIVIK